MDIKELLDEDAFDPKKLFNEKEYSTLIINREGFTKKENNTADLIEGLLDKEISRAESEEIFQKLKDSGAAQLLVGAIRKAERTDEKRKLTAACWESGLDFSNDFLFFVELATSDDFQLSMEALTVVENCEGTITNETLQKALSIAQTSKSKNEALTGDLLSNIRLRMA
jgi:hypothetical protein